MEIEPKYNNKQNSLKRAEEIISEHDDKGRGGFCTSLEPVKC